MFLKPLLDLFLDVELSLQQKKENPFVAYCNKWGNEPNR